MTRVRGCEPVVIVDMLVTAIDLLFVLSFLISSERWGRLRLSGDNYQWQQW